MVAKEDLTPTWPHVAYYFGVVAIFSIVFAGRFPAYRRDLIRRGEAKSARGIFITVLIFFAIAVAYGIVLIVRTIRS